MKNKIANHKIGIVCAIVALLAVSFITVHASSKATAEVSSINAPAMALAIDAADKSTEMAKDAAEAEAQRASAVEDRRASFQPSVKGTITRSSKIVRTPNVACGANPIRVEATNSGNDADYATLSAAFAAINAGTHTGTINIGVCADTAEPAGGAVLNASGGTSSYTSVLITPTGVRTISGAATAGLPLVDLNGADNVTIDGLNSGGNSLTISNTTASATAGTSTIRLIAGAAGNTITNCSVQGSSTASTTVAGGTILISTSTTGANSGNTISNNAIGPAGANLPTKGVMSLGSASPNNNTGNIINNNNVFDYSQGAITTAAGIDLQANTANTTVSNNRIYQTAPRVFSVSATYSGILMSSSGNANTITGNTIGFGAANGTGTTSISGSTNVFVGINLSSGSTTTATTVQGNTVSGIVQSTASTGTSSSAAFRGIYVAAGRYDVGTVTGNTIGSLDGSSTITFTESSTGACYGIYDFSSSSNPVSNNNIGSITINGTGTGTGGFRGIFLNTSSAASATLNNNTIANITDTLVGAYAMYAVQNSLANLSATGNVIRNISGNSNAATTIVTSGMVLVGTGVVGPNTISQNVVHSLSNNSGAASNSIYAIYCSFPATTANVVQRNLVHSLSINSTTTASQLVGILPVAGQGIYKNNMVRLGIDAAGNSISTGYQIYGMFEIAGTNNIYFNSCYVGGTNVSDASTTFAFVSNVLSGARNYIDNIFWNARSNGTGTGKHYAIALSGPGFTSNYNDLYASGTGGFVGTFGGVDQVTLANWQAATAQDANSKSVDPLFINPTGNAATVDLHLMPGSPMIAMATPVVGITNDYDNDTRNPCTPDIGADEQTSYGGPAVATLTITKTADAGTVTFGNQVGYVVKLTNTSANAALGLVVSDNLPAAPGVNWTIDAGATDPGWSVVGAPPTQSLQYIPSTLAGNAMTQAHVISATTVATCGSTLSNTASFSITNGCAGSNSGMASASIMVVGGGGPTTILNQGFESGLGAWTTINNTTTTGTGFPADTAWTIRPNPYTSPNSTPVTFNSSGGSNFILSNADLGASGTSIFTILQSPSFNTVGYTSLSVSFRHYYRFLSATEAFVEVSVDGGTTWTPLKSYTATQGAPTAFVADSVNMDAYVGQAMVSIRFRYQDGWSWYWAIDDIVVSGNAPIQPCPTANMLTSAASRLTHGAAGDFDIDLPLLPMGVTAGAGIECRRGAGAGQDEYTIVANFSGAITPADVSALTVDCGSVSAPVQGANPNQLLFVVSGACYNPTAAPQFSGIHFTVGGIQVWITWGHLLGDTNASTGVNSGDATQTKTRSGLAVDATTFRSDVNTDGNLNSGDTTFVKARSGQALP